jgi:nicotinate-nucleotide pyrophosphorylase (carboxylating)
MNNSIPTIHELIELAIREDIGSGDHTSLATIANGTKGKMKLLLKQNGILAGVEVARMVFFQIDPSLVFRLYIRDGESVMPGDVAFDVSGDVQSLLAAERLVLNYMQRMSGIATETNRLVKMVQDLPVKLLDTRKTTPNMRHLEKLAVRFGGGYNHRFGLFDMIMIKNNHVDFAGGIAKALQLSREYIEKNNLRLGIEVEVRNFDELETALKIGGFQRVMFDNFSMDDMRKAVKMVASRFETEASGGITEETLRGYAETGVDFISIGALTHQIKSLDMSLRAVI